MVLYEGYLEDDVTKYFLVEFERLGYLRVTDMSQGIEGEVISKSEFRSRYGHLFSVDILDSLLVY